MKTQLFLLLAAMAHPCFGLTDTIQQKTRITDVTVFFKGAQVTHKADLRLKKGRYLVIIDELPHELHPASIQTDPPPHCNIIAVNYRKINPNETRKGIAEEEINRKIEKLEERLKQIAGEQEVYDIEEKFLIDNSSMGSEKTGAAISQIKEAADFYRSRLNEIKRARLNLSLEIKSINKNIQDHYSKLNAITVHKRKFSSSLFITIECFQDISSPLSLVYYVSSAGWEPLYDFRVDDISKPFNIVYNANVFQSTGENWDNVKIKLSTGNPSLPGDRKKLQVWYLNRKTYKAPVEEILSMGALTGVARDHRTKEAIPFANISVLDNGNQIIASTTSDLDGQFTIKPIPPGTYNVKLSYIGYTAMQVNNIPITPAKITYQDFTLVANAVELEEVQIVAYQVPVIDPDTRSGQTITREDYMNIAMKDINSVAATSAGVYQADEGFNVRGQRSSSTSYFVDGVKVMGDVKAPEIETLYMAGNSQQKTIISREYLIDEPYTIPSDGSDNMLKIREATVAASYVYHAVPKLESDVFLSAEIANWEDLQLISGKTSIYFQGIYVGQSFINAMQTGDTLEVSLGRDKDVVVMRQGNKKISERKTSNGNIREIAAWDLSFRNNKKTPITVRVQDQYPISERGSIEVTLLESGMARVDEKRGLLSWEVSLKPGEHKEFTHSYVIRYPRWSRIITE